MAIRFELGDILLSHSRSGILGPIIRFFEQRPGDPANYNHAAIITAPGDAQSAELVEAMWHVRKIGLWQAYGPPAGDKRAELAVWRLCGPTDWQRTVAVAKALSHVGQDYPWWELLEHGADWWLSKQAGHDVVCFRRLAALDKSAVCSHLVEDAWSDYTTFGVLPGTASPDSIDDFVQTPGNAVRVFAGVLGTQE